MSEQTIVCVLGMHRSGTSLVSRVLNVLGLDLGPEEHLMRPSSANPAGHWESLPIKEINDEILRRLGGSWDDPPELVPGWERTPELAEPRRQARALIEADFSGSDLWGFKDPRTSLTAPFWQRFLDPMRYVVCIRNPLDVAASLEAREAEPVPFERGIELWLTYTRAALAVTAGHPRELVFYEDLMADPEPPVDRLARFIGAHQSDAPETEAARAAIGIAMSEGLWHHRTTVPNVVDATRLAFHVKAHYLALRMFVPGPDSVGAEVLDLLGGYAAEAGRQFAELDAKRAELEEVREQSRSLDRERAALGERLADREAELEAKCADLEEVREQSRSLDRERAALGERLADREAELEAKCADLEEVREQSRSLDRERAALGERLADREAELEDREAELETRRVELEKLREQSSGHGSSGDGAPAHASDDERLVGEIQARVRELIPSGATILVAGKGDDALLQLDGSRGWQFPIGAGGGYAGDHPAGDTAVIARLEALRARGADHLLLPATTLWWLDRYDGLRRHLEDRCERLVADEHCAIYRLGPGDRKQETDPLARLKRAVAGVRSGRDPAILDWGTELGIADQFPELPVFTPPGEEAALPYLDGTVDIVVLASADTTRIAEARRVAASTVIRVDPSDPGRAELEWSVGGQGGWGEDVSVTLIPDADGPAWDATFSAVSETLSDGFAGALSVIGEPARLGRASELAGAAGGLMRPVEVPPGATFAERARAATKAAEQPVQVFVTAPAVPLPDWLPSILALFGSDSDAGVIGARILSPDGALEEAGGVLDADGSRRRRGEGDHDPDRPEYGFVRRVDFCSPPLVATRRALFERLAGLDDRYVAPTAALVDFSLRAGQSGAPVYYQPQARVVTIGDAGR